MSTNPPIDLMDLGPFEQGVDHELFRVLRNDDPVHWNPEPDGPGFWSLTRHEDIRAVASDHETFSSAQGTQIPSRRAEGDGEASIHNMDPPQHSALRKLVVPHVRPAKVKGLTEPIVEVIDNLLDGALATQRDGPFDFVAEVSSQLPLLVVGRLLGAPAEDCPDLLRWTNQMASEDPEYSAGPETGARARDEVFAYFHELERSRREEPASDLVSVLSTAEVEGCPLNRGQLDAYYLVLMVAGNETTRNLLSGGVEALGQNPGEWEALRQNPERIPTVVEEMVRWVSPVLSMRRTARVDTQLRGTSIAAGDKVVLWFCSGNRDEQVFDEPDRFIGDRGPNDHLGFGWGAHACLGAHLARLETKLFLQRLVERGLRVEPVEGPDRLQSNFFRGIKHLRAKLVTDDG